MGAATSSVAGIETHHDEHGEHLREVPEQVAQRHRHEVVDLVQVLREAVRYAPHRRTLEERERRAQQTRYSFIVNLHVDYNYFA